jgi:hypothetical protein
MFGEISHPLSFRRGTKDHAARKGGHTVQIVAQRYPHLRRIGSAPGAVALHLVVGDPSRPKGWIVQLAEELSSNGRRRHGISRILSPRGVRGPKAAARRSPGLIR